MEDALRQVFAGSISAAERAKITSEVRAGLPSKSRSGPIRRRNFIDDHIFKRIERDHIPHPGLSTDEEFLHRVTLDLTGQISGARTVREFVKDRRPDKRDRLIDSPIGSEAYLDYWTYWYGDLFHIGRGELGGCADLFALWIREQLKANVREMLTASGKNNALGRPAFNIFPTNNVYEKEFVQATGVALLN